MDSPDYADIILLEVSAGISPIEEYEGVSLEPGHSYPFDIGATPDVMVTRAASDCPGALDELDEVEDWFPDSLDQIERVERWFTEPELRIPIIGVEAVPDMGPVSRGDYSTIVTKSENLMQLFGPNGLVIVDDTLDLCSVERSVDSPVSLVQADLTDRSRVRESVLAVVNELVTDLLDTPVEALPGAGPLFKNIHTEIFHFNEVLRAYKRQQVGPLVVLLSVYFESHCLDLLTNHLNELKRNPNAGRLFDSDESFKRILDMCRFFALVKEDEYRIMDELRRARNRYAHHLRYYRPNKRTNLEAEDSVNEAIELYESLVGVKQSMIE